MGYANTDDGQKIWYAVTGETDRETTPLLLIQGLALDHHGWDSADGDFDGRPVIVMDHRGTGASGDHFPDDWSMSGFARDAVAVLDAAGVQRAMVYGHSMGGRIAQWLGALHPDRVAALVLGSTTVGDGTGVARPQHATDALNSGDGARLSALFYTDAWLAEHPHTATSVLPSASISAMGAHLAAVARHDGPVPAQIKPPTLILHGADDELAVVENARLLAREIPRSTLRVFDGERHVYWVASERPHAVVRAFLEEHDRR
ncbi:alpha/beta fold hydrolase [Actinomadura fibrosa]|uniref:Alpha/beta fold hydrolase n=1 Tax=Actinomadura fibrosa TaxID=111802 RepID=A0ABW2XNT2_9ACTN|nr:alpha/beta hydrolase [Actinomadura fibrosa]